MQACPLHDLSAYAGSPARGESAVRYGERPGSGDPRIAARTIPAPRINNPRSAILMGTRISFLLLTFTTRNEKSLNLLAMYHIRGIRRKAGRGAEGVRTCFSSNRPQEPQHPIATGDTPAAWLGRAVRGRR